jgi:hypothetical protein
VATRSANKEEVIAKEKAEQQAQKKETAQKKAKKDLLVRPKTPTKARKASVSQPQLAKQTKTGRTIKAPVIFEKGTNQVAK